MLILQLDDEEISEIDCDGSAQTKPVPSNLRRSARIQKRQVLANDSEEEDQAHSRPKARTCTAKKKRAGDRCESTLAHARMTDTRSLDYVHVPQFLPPSALPATASFVLPPLTPNVDGVMYQAVPENGISRGNMFKGMHCGISGLFDNQVGVMRARQICCRLCTARSGRATETSVWTASSCTTRRTALPMSPCKWGSSPAQQWTSTLRCLHPSTTATYRWPSSASVRMRNPRFWGTYFLLLYNHFLFYVQTSL